MMLQSVKNCIEIKSQFEVQSGVYKGCILSPVLFLLVIGNVSHAALFEKYGGLQWTVTSFFKYFNYTDEICLLSHRVMYLGRMAMDLEI